MEGSTDPRAPADERCPLCGARAEPGQLVCLECGARLALDYRRPRGWKLPVAVVLGVLLVGAGGFAFALARLSDDAESEVASAPTEKEDERTASSGQRGERADRSERRPKPPARRERAARRERPVRRERPRSRRPERRPAASDRSARSWPAGRDGFTVVLISTEDPSSAREFARSARQGGTEVGLLRSNDYPSLQSGFWIVFSGVYRSRAEAQRAADRLGRGFPGAFPQFVNGSRAKRR